MKVRELMQTNVAWCGPRTDAASIAEILWTKDCGSVPVVDERNRILGIVTDRDLFIALGTRNHRASELKADEVMRREVVTCGPEDDVKQALAVMQTRRVRRIPVIDSERTVRGMLSVEDLVRHSARRPKDLPAADLMTALAQILDHGPNRVNA